MATNCDSNVEYNNLEIVGPIQVEAVERTAKGTVWVLFLMGPTGAGKSSFVEALAPKGSMHISSNQLEGFTQSITTYHLQNVTHGDKPVYVVDIPGFADTKISQLSIISMLKDWIAENNDPNFGRILYLTPISHVRLPGSQRQVLGMFRSLTGVDTAENITIVSTMWDCMWNESALKRAESTFNQLRDDVWKTYIDQGSEITRFHNTHHSAMSVLDNAFGRLKPELFRVEKILNSDEQLRDTEGGSYLYDDLQARIQTTSLQRANIQSELRQASDQAHTYLTSLLSLQLAEVEKLIERFGLELSEFCQSSIPQLLPTQLRPTDVELPISPHTPRSLEQHQTPAAEMGLISGIVGRIFRAIQFKREIFVKAIGSLKCCGKSASDVLSD